LNGYAATSTIRGEGAMNADSAAGAGQLFTLAALGTFTGLTGATVVVTNTISRITNWAPAWLGFVVALLLCSAAPILANGFNWTQQLLAMLNACLVYLSAAGANTAGTAAIGDRPPPARPSFSLVRPWF
jgi:hypothetical protein